MTFKTLILGAVAGTAALAALSGPASAYIACNSFGDCWHTESRYGTRPGVTFQYHPDDWYFHRTWGDRDRYRYRAYHEGRGYWGRDGVWITF